MNKCKIKVGDFIIYQPKNDNRHWYGVCTRIKDDKIWGVWEEGVPNEEEDADFRNLTKISYMRKNARETWSEEDECKVLESPANLNILVGENE